MQPPSNGGGGILNPEIPPDGYYVVTYNSNGQALVSLDSSNSGVDQSVTQAIWDMAQPIRSWVLAQLEAFDWQVQLLSFLYNNANRMVVQWLAGTLQAFLSLLSPIFQTYLGHVVANGVVRQIWPGLEALVAALDAWYHGTGELRRLSTANKHAWSLRYDALDTFGGASFVTGTGLALDSSRLALKVTNTSGYQHVELDDLVSSTGRLETGFTLEFAVHFDSLGTLTIPYFASISYATQANQVGTVGLGTDVLGLYTCPTGIKAAVNDETISCLSSDFNMSLWMHIALWHQDGQWRLVVTQGNTSTGAQTHNSPSISYGVHNLQLSGSDVGGMLPTFWIRDIVVSHNAEYSTNSLPGVYNGHWDHGSDVYAGMAPTFYPSLAAAFNTPQDTVYTFTGGQSVSTSFDPAVVNNPGTLLDHSGFTVGSGAWSLAFHFKRTGSSTHQALFTRDPDSSTDRFICQVLYGDIYCRIADDLTPWAMATTINTWYSMCITWDGSSDSGAWVDHVQQVHHSNGSAGLTFTSATSFRVGIRPDGASPFVGQMKNISFYHRVLSQNEILSL